MPNIHCHTVKLTHNTFITWGLVDPMFYSWSMFCAEVCEINSTTVHGYHYADLNGINFILFKCLMERIISG